MKVRNVSVGIRGYAKVGKSVAICAPGEVVEIPADQRAKFLARLTDAWEPVDPPAWPTGTPKARTTLEHAQQPGVLAVSRIKAAAERTMDPPKKS